MLATYRPIAAAGVAMVGASAIAMSPVALQPMDFRTEHAIQLTASANWQDVLTAAGQNASALFNSWLQAPAPILQQIIANQQKYLSELPDLATIGGQIQANLQHALDALVMSDSTTLDATHRTLYQLLPTVLQLPGIPDLLHFNISATGQQLLGFSTTALGIALGGLLSPGGSIFNALDMAYDNNLLGVLHIHVPIATGATVGPLGAIMELTRAIARATGRNGAATAAAAPTGLAAVDAVPRSVLNSGTTVSAPVIAVDQSAVDAATSPRQSLALPARTIRGAASLDAASPAAKRTVGHSTVASHSGRAGVSASDSGTTATARTKRSAGAAAAG